ncbi:MAG: substrate-binding domain-containing protein [Oscillospiraceae bacterium]|nr:substrate-binding domain-containing protein [Oscillospiraceae bacterium]
MKRFFKYLSIPIIMAVVAITIVVFVTISEQAQKSPSIIYVGKTSDTSIEFWGSIHSGMETAETETGIEVRKYSSPDEQDAQTQIQIMERCISKNPDVIILVPSDVARLVPITKKAVESGIPVITLDSHLNYDKIKSEISTNNIEAGKKAGDALCQHLEQGSKVAIISHIQTASTAIEREKGARLALESKELQIVDTAYCEGSEELAYQNTLRIIEQNPDLAGIVALNEVTALGSARAITDVGLAGKIKLVGFDSSKAEIQLIENGTICATVVQRPFNMGYLAVMSAIEIANGKSVPSQIDTGSVTVTKDNMYGAEIQKLIFPFGE